MNTFIELARFSLSVVSNPALNGGVTLTAGSNVTLSQIGQNITISATGGGGSGITQLTGNVTAGPGSGSQIATIAAGAVTNAMLAGSIAFSNLATQPSNVAIISDGSGFLVGSSVTATELGYVSGVTSPIQTQLNGKQASGSYLTASTGVTDIHADSSAALHGAVQFVSGTNITLSQVGQAITIAAAGASGANTALSNLAAVAVNTSILPGVDNTIDLGNSSSPLQFRSLYLASNLVFNGVASFNYDITNGAMNWNNANNVYSTNGIFFKTDAAGNTGPYLSMDPITAHATTIGDNTVGHDSVSFDENATAGETPMLLWDITAATLQRVSIGAADSGGTGFRVLRIPN